MTPSMTLELVLWSAGVLVIVGVIYGDIRSRLGRIEKMLGTNGVDGIFVRRNEYKVIREAQAEVHSKLTEDVLLLKTTTLDLVTDVATLKAKGGLE